MFLFCFVAVLPKEDPQISGVELQYQIGDEINLNCTSGKSHPASVLHWYINEQQVIAILESIIFKLLGNQRTCRELNV